MDEKLLIQDIINLLAEKQGMERAEAEALVKAMLELVESALATDKYVKIKGLGTFKLTEVESRESVHVNTGERIEIQGHTKVSFTPDNAMKELINKPFSHFEPVVLNEGVNLEAMMATDEPVDEQETSVETPMIEETLAETPVVEETVAIVEETEVKEEPVAVIEPDSEPVIEEPLAEEPAEEIIEEPKAEAIEEEVKMETIDEIEEKVTSEETAQPVVEEPVPVSEPVKEKDTKTTRVLMGIIVVLVLIILFGFYWLFLRSDDVTPSPKTANPPLVEEKTDVAPVVTPTPVEEKVEETPKADTVVAVKKPVSKPVSSAPVATLSDTLEYEIVGTQTSHTLQEGETLIKLAVRFYGSKNFWPYILQHNRSIIKDADRVPIGTTLQIPALKTKAN